MNKKISLAAGTALLTLTVLLTIVYAALSGVFVSAEKTPPCDIEDSYAYEAIKKVCELGLMNTYTIEENVYFYPEMEVTRGEVARVIVTYLGINPAKNGDRLCRRSGDRYVAEALYPRGACERAHEAAKRIRVPSGRFYHARGNGGYLRRALHRGDIGRQKRKFFRLRHHQYIFRTKCEKARGF